MSVRSQQSSPLGGHSDEVTLPIANLRYEAGQTLPVEHPDRADFMDLEDLDQGAGADGVHRGDHLCPDCFANRQGSKAPMGSSLLGSAARSRVRLGSS